MANYNVDIDVAVRGYNRVEQTLKRLDRLIGPPRVLEINPGIQFRKFRQQKLQLLKEMRRAGVEAAVAFQQAFEREARIARQVAGAGSRTLPPAAGPIALLPATAVGQFQRAAAAAKAIDMAFANAKRSIDGMTTQLMRALPGGTGVSGPGVRIAGLLPPAGGFGGGAGGAGGGGGGFGSFRAPRVPGPGQGISPRSLFTPIGSPQINIPENFNAAVASGAFPLLFGGGVGQAAGGFAGGLATGKMFSGLTISLQVAGAALDAFVADTAQTGNALTETGSAFQLMTERSLFSTKEAQHRAATLEKLGEKEKLAALLTDELTEKIGSTGFDAMIDLGKETDKTTRLWNELTLQLQALIAGPLAELLSIIGDLLGNQVELNRLNALRKDLAGTRAGAQLEKQISAKTSGKTTADLLGGGKNAGLLENLAAAVLMGPDLATEEALSAAGVRTFEMEGILSDLSTEELADLRKQYEKFRPEPKNQIKLTQDLPKPPKERESRVPQLAIEVGLTERLNTLNRQILQAKQDEDPVREAALQMEVAMEKEAAKIAKINLDKIPQAEKDLQIKEVGLQTDQEIFEINHKLKDLRQAQAEKNQEIIADFQSQNDLLQAQLDGRLEEEQIEQTLAKLKDENKGLDIDKVRNILEANNVLKEQIAVAEELDRLYETIGQSISSSIVDALTAAVDETKSLADIATQTLRQIANILLQFGVQTALSSLGGNDGGGFFSKLFPARALGGAVGANQPYMVGEKGPELFVPGAQGNIVPNNAMGGSNIVVNVDASGSNVEGSGQQAKALGQAIGAAVQAEIVKQKMPGGLLN